MRHLSRCCAGLAALTWCLQFGTAQAFPLATEDDPSFIPQGADLTTPDAQALQHQMALANGFASLGSAQGWVILPRVSLEEEFTDNVNEVASPRRWDLTTIVGPGVTVLGDSDRVQLRLDYEPDLSMHLRTGSQNILAQQLNAVGTLTVVPDLFYVDVRALAGSQATNGGIGGTGGLGQTGIGGVTGTSLTPLQSDTVGLAKQNRTETASASISPYMLYQFGDFGSTRVGISLSRTVNATASGFAPIPFVSQSNDSQSFTSVEEDASFQTGPQFARFRDTFTADGLQGEGSNIGATTTQRDTASNRVDYQINRTIDVYGQLGWEIINYGGANALNISDMTWGVGTVLTPDPDTEISLGYGHQNATNSITASARYALTARTVLTASYNNGIGTQLEQVAGQLDQASVANNGSLVNSQTGGTLFAANNALAVSTGVYRYNDLTFGATTTLNRDTFNLSVTHSEETLVGAGVQSSSNGVTTASFTWTHELSPDTVATATSSYSFGTPAAGSSANSLLAALSLQYTVTDTLTTFASYTLYSYQSSVAAQSWYQNVALVGFTKQF